MSTAFTRVLIANRGEIAVRIAKSVQGAGYHAIAIYSDPDANAPHVAACDSSVALGGDTAASSYLDANKVISAAKISGAQAIHPGYGFLSENAEFAAACEDAGLVFIGPTPAAIELMGNKRAAKEAVAAAGVPCIPGFDGGDQSESVIIEQANKIGVPIMVKAAAGGGGRGMRLVTDMKDVASALASARAEAKSAFGNDEIILEKAITSGRHVEIQVAADSLGHIIHLGERDCSLQRRHQKVVEEAPSPFVDPALREAMGTAAVAAAKSCDYRGVGTVEFLVADDKTFSFLEMNTRLQVEHPVTELVTGVDLVDLQLRIAQGEPLGLAQDDINLTGHAIEIRLYAEDPAAGFMPQTGHIAHWQAPAGEGVRVDSGIASGQDVSPYYDPMLAKIMAFGSNREQARQRLLRAMDHTALLGVKTNQQFLRRLLADPVFVRGDATITYLDDNLGTQEDPPLTPGQVGLAAALLMHHLDPQSSDFLNWSNAEPMPRRKSLRLNGEDIAVTLLGMGSEYTVSSELGEAQIRLLGPGEAHNSVRVIVNGVSSNASVAHVGTELFAQLGDITLAVEDLSYLAVASADAASSGEIQASTEGLLIAIHVAVGDRVTQGQNLAVVEAMKMEHRHLADGDGVVTNITASVDNQVSKGQLLLQLELDSEDVA